ncbi:SpoIID/LytB domain-containing protein [bacterium]|nr:MAG: SpoIID/LytB domain-containing protein [bacterium]
MKVLYFCTVKILIAFIFSLVLFFDGALHAQQVSLSRLNEVRVWLFSDIQVDELRASPKNSPFELVLDSKKTIEIEPSEWISIRKQGSFFSISHGNSKWKVKEFEIKTDEIGLVNLVSVKSSYRYYRGELRFNSKTGIRPLNVVSLEDYVASVVGSEMNFENPEALKVQAVISRTYALWNLGTAGKKDWYDLTDHTMNQVYNGELIEKPWYRDAALATSGEIATFTNKVILAVFSSTCGGHTSDNETTWSGKALPYLRGLSDHDACKKSPHFSWNFSLSKKEWNTWFSNHYPSYKGDIEIKKRTSDDRVSELSTTYSQGIIKANDFRLKLIKSFGARSLKSTAFEIIKSPDSISFVGKGMGHGIGVCQWGTLGLAESGWNYKDILRFYYGGIEIKDVYFDPKKEYLELAN